MPSRHPVQFAAKLLPIELMRTGESQGVSIRTAADRDFADSIEGSVVRGGKKTCEISSFRTRLSSTRGAKEFNTLRDPYHSDPLPPPPATRRFCARRSRVQDRAQC